ncbi:MAG: diguanylate cyclase protein [Clostridia bacterium]|nr:diguanylate cyclase protein [Clostridia bacterium]
MQDNSTKEKYDLNGNSTVVRTTDEIIICDYGVKTLCKARELAVSLVDNSDLLVNIWKFDGTLIKFNNYAQIKTGFREEDVLGGRWVNTILPESHVPGLNDMFSRMEKGYTPPATECKLYCKNGKELDILWSNYIMRDRNHKPTLAVSVGMDITELKDTTKKLATSYSDLHKIYSKLEKAQKQLEKQLKDQNDIKNALLISEERYKLAMEGSNDGIWDLDILNNREFFYSDKCAEMLGYTKEEIKALYKSWRELIHSEDYERFDKHLSDYLSRKIPIYDIEYRLRTKTGEYIWVLSRGKAIWDEDNNPLRMAGSNTNIQEKKIAQEAVYRLAYCDELTGLPNKALLWKELTEELKKAESKGLKSALLSMDIDDFKDINDIFGHNNGDELLKVVSRRLEKLTDSSVTIARSGGDEFLVLIKNAANESDVVKICNSIIDEFNSVIVIEDLKMHVSVSIGGAIYPEHGQDEYTLFKSADIAMYNAKAQSGNSFELYNNEMNDEIIEKLGLENGLKEALDNDEFCIYYQPQISIETSEVIGLEALIRWQHPVKGLISPFKFIPIAEESGLIIQIGEVVLRKACQQFVEWKKNNIEPKRIAVNISAKQFEQKNFVAVVKSIISNTGIDPKYLELEITESIAMKNLDYTINVINELKNLNIKVSLDDFGTGYSSLNYLMRLPINTLKIDKSFLDNIKLNSNEELIAKTIIALAKNMNLDVVAEGVETFDQLEFLRKQSCDIAQGYLFSRPVPENEVRELLLMKKIIAR